MTASWKDHIEYILARGSIDNLLIISSEDGATWASSAPYDESNPSEGFYLKEYKAVITQEDGSEKEEVVNEAKNILAYMQGKTCGQGLRINGTKKQQVTRTGKGEETDMPVMYARFPSGGSIVASAGKCILIATFDENKGHQPSICNDTINQMANYILKSTWPTGAEAKGSLPGPDNASPATWQAYIDTLLVAKGHIADAVIVDVKSEKVLASTPNFGFKEYTAEIAQEDGTDKKEQVLELQNMVKFATTGQKPSQGVRINEVKYQVVRSNVEDENSKAFFFTGKKPMAGCTIFFTGKFLLIGLYDEKKGHQAVENFNILSDLARHLKETAGE